MNSRQSHILELVNERQRIQVAELSELTGVSGVTIRQDLNVLEKQGHLKRVHGGAIAVLGGEQSDDIEERLLVRLDIKEQLAAKAAEQVGSGETVLIEGGSANALLARILAERGDVTIITPSAYIAHLIRESAVTVILLGGVYQSQGESTVGPLTKLCIKQVHFSTAFLGVDGFHQDTGFTGRDMMRAEIAEAIIAKKKRNVVLTDASKFGQIYASSIGQNRDISILVTEEDAPEKDLEFLRQQGIEVILSKKTDLPDQGCSSKLGRSILENFSD